MNLANPMHRTDFGLVEHLQKAGFSLIQEATSTVDDTRVWRRVR
jgi:hypothetical protein